MIRFSYISKIATALPNTVVTNNELASLHEDWSAEKIFLKTGIRERRVCGPEETASTLAVSAAEKLFSQDSDLREQVDFVILCTQSPDTQIPTTACTIQEQLELDSCIGAFDINLGCSGYVYSLGVAKGLLETGQANNVLLLTADHYSKFMLPNDLSVRTLFGDGGTATLVTTRESTAPLIGPFINGTDGSGSNFFALKQNFSGNDKAENCECPSSHIVMNGPEIFTFTLKEVPSAVTALLAKAQYSLGDIDFFVFHQANEYILNHLQKKLDIPRERFVVSMEKTGNTVGSSIPIALSTVIEKKKATDPCRVMLVGFGVGLSWSATIVRI